MKKKNRCVRYVILILVLFMTMINLAQLALRSVFIVNYGNEVQNAAAEYEVTPFLILAVINAESGFRKDAVSRQGASGLMQLTQETYQFVRGKTEGKEALADDIFDPRTNVLFGTFYLSYLLKEFETLPEALAAYNAGPSKVKSWLADSAYCEDGKTLKRIPYAETEAYIKKVLFYLKAYEMIYS